ncbi:MAG: hypothetical protein GMKNLPBB_00758 [Myxococcota bacterium]|nr:hypothetical protein [Myxococcota bacterium]
MRHFRLSFFSLWILAFGAALHGCSSDNGADSATDSGAGDTAQGDSSAGDSAPPDAGPADTAPADANAADATPDDGGGPADAGSADSGPTDAQPGDTSPPIRDISRCDDTVELKCLLPFPSNHWTKTDKSTETGLRVDIPKDAAPWNVDNAPALPPDLASLDGFSHATPIMFHLGQATLTGVAGQNNIEKSLEKDHPTVLFDPSTGARVPHWVEMDRVVTEDKRRIIFIRPAARLKNAARYIVAVRGMKKADGSPASPYDLFRIFRDNAPTARFGVEERRPRYELMFVELEKAGIPRKDLQLAWDFTTQSKRNATSRMAFIRDDALAKGTADGPQYEIASVEKDYSPQISVFIRGAYTVPLYVNSGKAGATFAGMLDAQGNPQAKGTMTAPFYLMIPRKLAETGGKAGVLQYGHGLLGDGRAELGDKKGNYLQEIANETGMIVAATDWKGMSREDYDAIVGNALFDSAGFSIIPDRLHQGVLNSALLIKALHGKLGADREVTLDGKIQIDPANTHFYGNSQGSIVGGAYVAMSKDIRRAVLGVGGSGFSWMLTRSTNFKPFFDIMKLRYQDAVDHQLLIAIFQMLWSRAESAGYDAHITGDPITPDTPVKQVLVQYGLGDVQVTNLVTHQFARAANLTQLTPNNGDIFGLQTAAGPVRNGIVDFNFRVDSPPETNIASSTDNKVHGNVRETATSKKQIIRFLTTGEIAAACDGPCDPL